MLQQILTIQYRCRLFLYLMCLIHVRLSVSEMTRWGRRWHMILVPGVLRTTQFVGLERCEIHLPGHLPGWSPQP